MTFDGPIWRTLGHLADVSHLERWSMGGRWIALVFHHITDESKYHADDPFIKGLNVSITLDAFEARLRWLRSRYEFASLKCAIDNKVEASARQKVLICFDDGYASAFHLAAPIMRQLNIPWTFFINPGLVGNPQLSVDNIVAFIANCHGVEPLSSCASMRIADAHDFISRFLSTLPPRRRRDVVEKLAVDLGIDLRETARSAQLYVNENEIRMLAEAGVEIGCHTLDHVHCRTLDAVSAATQIELSGRLIERMSGRPVRAFAYPYGSVMDVTPTTRRAIHDAGHECAFLVHNRANFSNMDRYSLYRIDLGDVDDCRAALELEVLPRLRGALAGVRASLKS